MFKSWPRRAASSFVQYNTGCVVPYFLYAYESVFPINLPKLFTHQWKILLPMQAGPDVTIRAANRTISALFARSLLRSLGASPCRGFGEFDHLASRRKLGVEAALLRLLPRFRFAYIESF